MSTPSQRSGRTIRGVVTSARPTGLAGWWPVGVALALLIGAVTLAPSSPAESVLPVAGEFGLGPGGSAGGAVEGGASPTSAEGGSLDPVTGESAVPGATNSGAVADGDSGGVGGVPTSITPEAAGDRSHCTADGRQHDVRFHAPPCVPVFVGDNGGATARGVTGETIKVVAFNLRCDPTTELLLQSLGFESASCEQQAAMMRAAVNHMNDRLELYGRRIEVEFVFADCPYPEDLDSCLADARAAMAKEPFAVVTTFAGTYQAVWEEFARNGVVMIGGGSLAGGSYLQHSPFWWSRTMSSTLQAALVADWWCAELAGRSADHSGPTIHPSIGKRGEVTRRVGLAYYDAPAGHAAADQMKDDLEACGTEMTTFAYSADASTIQQQSLAATSRFIADGVTTVMWFDYLGPTFALPEMTRQRYFPEHINAGGSGATADSSHRSLDVAQWRHSFGLFPEGIAMARNETESASVLRDGGFRGGIPPFPDSYINELLMLGDLIQAAGPSLTPSALRAIETQPRRGGDGSGDGSGPREGISFGPDDHTGIDDMREVYFDPDAVSPIDGLSGAVVNADGGARRGIGGAWAGPDAVPVSRS